jgi:hypothetical protein
MRLAPAPHTHAAVHLHSSRRPAASTTHTYISYQRLSLLLLRVLIAELGGCIFFCF